MKDYIAAAIVGLALIAMPFKSEARVSRCDTCYTDRDFKEYAQTLGTGTHQIYNLDANILQVWRVPVGTPGMDPRALPTKRGLVSAQGIPSPITKQNPSPYAIDELDKAHKVYVIGGGTLRPIINVPISALDLPYAQDKTAYHVVRDSNLRAMIESAAADHGVVSTVTGENLLTAIADLTNLATSQLGLRDKSALLFRIVMTDGSYYHIRIEIAEPNGEFVEDSARTDGGQLIPTELEDVQGTWTSEFGDDLSAMANHMRNLGATVNFVGGGASGSIRGISCTGSGAGKICIVTTIIR